MFKKIAACCIASTFPVIAFAVMDCPLANHLPLDYGAGFLAQITTNGGGTHYQLLAEYDKLNDMRDLGGGENYIWCDNSTGSNKHQFSSGAVNSDWEYLYESYPMSSYDYARVNIVDTGDTSNSASSTVWGD